MSTISFAVTAHSEYAAELLLRGRLSLSLYCLYGRSNSHVKFELTSPELGGHIPDNRYEH